MWEISVNNQITAVLCSLVLGAVLAVFYDIIRALRKSGFNSFVAVFLCDIFFFALSAVAVFIFLVGVTNGEVRGYVIFACAAGFIIYRLTVSKAVFYVVYKLFAFISFVIKRIWLLFYRLLQLCGIPVSFIAGRLKSSAKHIFASLKKLLKNIWDMLYTVRDKKDLEYDADEQG